MSVIVRYDAGHGPAIGALSDRGIHPFATATLAELLADGANAVHDSATAALARPPAHSSREVRLLAPIDGRTELWGAGVTYRRSRDARVEESHGSDIYELIYDADRPELFFKAPAWRVVGPDGPVAVRSDSRDSVAEPELALVLDSRGAVAGYTICNDVTSRSIEAENPLYLPQAKSYRGSAALGPCIATTPGVDAQNVEIALRVWRDQAIVFRGSTTTRQMRRSFDELAGWLTSALEFPEGVVLSTGTGIVPPLGDTLLPGDVVEITIDGIGALWNSVELLDIPTTESIGQQHLAGGASDDEQVPFVKRRPSR